MSSIKLLKAKCFVACVLGFCIALFSCSPKISQREKVEPSKPTPGVSHLCVMSYNIHHCNSRSRPNLIVVEAAVNFLSRQNLDIIALQ